MKQIYKKVCKVKCLADFFYANEILLDGDEIIVLLSALHKKIFSIDKVIGCDKLIKGREFLLIQAYTTSFDEFSHLTLAWEDVHSLLIEHIYSGITEQ